jgi:hypothetical protein
MSAPAEPITKACRCKHMESSHDDGGCFWCRCKHYRYDRTTSINIDNEIAVSDQNNRALRALFERRAS